MYQILRLADSALLRSADNKTFNFIDGPVWTAHNETAAVVIRTACQKIGIEVKIIPASASQAA